MKIHTMMLLLTKLSLFLAVCIFQLSTQSNPATSTPHTNSNTEQKAPVMLAHQWDHKVDIKGWWMSEKLDGVRGYWTGKELISRAGNPFHAPEWFTRNFPPTPLDGELWTGREQFPELVSIVRRESADTDWGKVHYFVFDAPEIEGCFEKRLDFVRRWFLEHPNLFAEVLEHQICESEEHLQKKLTEIESLGGEGVMLRKPDSPYTVGRSHDLLKVKTYEDAEATVIKYLPGSGRNAERLGSLLVELPNGIQFAIGTGFPDEERNNPPAIGSIITFKYYGFYKSGIPKFASFLRIREEY
jgi:DNA ligase-1